MLCGHLSHAEVLPAGGWGGIPDDNDLHSETLLEQRRICEHQQRGDILNARTDELSAGSPAAPAEGPSAEAGGRTEWRRFRSLRSPGCSPPTPHSHGNNRDGALNIVWGGGIIYRC